jgi:hypothetical protein
MRSPKYWTKSRTCLSCATIIFTISAHTGLPRRGCAIFPNRSSFCRAISYKRYAVWSQPGFKVGDPAGDGRAPAAQRVARKGGAAEKVACYRNRAIERKLGGPYMPKPFSPAKDLLSTARFRSARLRKFSSSASSLMRFAPSPGMLFNSSKARGNGLPTRTRATLSVERSST